jgi:hypothetical protein
MVELLQLLLWLLLLRLELPLLTMGDCSNFAAVEVGTADP